LYTKGNIFGGFTPVEWASSENVELKADESQKSFLFTLKNPHNIPARRFTLKADKKHQAIYCNSEWGPRFGSLEGRGCDIAVSDNCNRNTGSYSVLNGSYTNDTALDGRIIFTGSRNFQVKEIEVFEITD
jgi:hypothetical protein